MKYPLHFVKLIDLFKKLPGIGAKSAERFAFELLKWPEQSLQQMADLISDTPRQLRHCMQCGSLTGIEDCHFCHSSRKNQQTLCVVATPRDVFAIEATREYHGLYHVLGCLLSPLQGIGPEHLCLSKLKERITTLNIQEVVIALDSTLEGDATALFLKQQIDPLQIQTSRLAFGLPMGSSFDYVDGGTLARALSARNHF